MIPNSTHQYTIKIDLKRQPLSQNDINKKVKLLKSTYRGNINFVIALLVLASGITYRALSLNFDSDLELFRICIYVGTWFGVFTGMMIDGDSKRKLQMITVGILTSSSSGLCASMLVMLFTEHAITWVTSVTILASALSSMWLLTYYDEVLKGLELLEAVNKKQLAYIKKAANHFDELNTFLEMVKRQGRPPLTAEYWAFREWVANKANSIA